MKTLIALVPVLFAGMLTTALATSFAPPTDRVVKSPNGTYALHIHAKSGKHEIKKGNEVLWSFKRDVWHNDYYLSDNGKHVLWVGWQYIKVSDASKTSAIAVYSADGSVSERTISKVSTPRRYKKTEIGPIGSFWRIWRDKSSREGEIVTIPVAGKKTPLRVALDGSQPQ